MICVGLQRECCKQKADVGMQRGKAQPQALLENFLALLGITVSQTLSLHFLIHPFPSFRYTFSLLVQLPTLCSLRAISLRHFFIICQCL